LDGEEVNEKRVGMTSDLVFLFVSGRINSMLFTLQIGVPIAAESKLDVL
jgi:hypothetical protein